MVTKDELLDMIEHSIHYSGENYAVVFYPRYVEAVAASELTAEEKEACGDLLRSLSEDAGRHVEALRALRERIERDGRRAY